MIRQFVQITFLIGTLIAGFVPVALANSEDTLVSRGVVATVTTLNANTAMATLRTEDGGEVFAHPQESSWHVGHKVLCDRIEGSQPRLQNCRPWESAHRGTGASRLGLAPRR